MKHYLGRIVVMLMLFGTVALAQDEMSVLERYALAVENLHGSVASVADNPGESDESLTRAENAFRLLSRETRSEALRGGLAATFEQARTAITRRSGTDLAVQTAVIRGGLQRIVYEAALVEAGAGDVATAQSYLSRLGEDLGFTAGAQAAVDGSASLAQLLAAFEAGVGESIAARLEEARSEDTQDAYLHLAGAYAAFIPIQDSLHAADTTTDAFISAITVLLSEDREAFMVELANLEGQVAGLTGASVEEIALEPISPLVAGLTGASVEEVSVEPVSPLPAPAVEAAPLPAQSGQPAVSPQEMAPVADGEAFSEGAVAFTVGEEAEPSAATRRQDIEAALASYGLEAGALEPLVNAYEAAGYAAPQEVISHLYATSAHVLIAVQDGRTVEAQAAIATLRQDYQAFLQPLVRNRQPEAHGATLDLLYSLEAAPSLNLQAVAVLTAQVSSLAAALEGEALPLKQQANVLTSLYWSSFAQAILLALLALLAFYPLYLLNLAFGGNRHWRWIGVALFLLLLPVIYEGLAQAGALIAHFTGMPEFALLLGFSPFQNAASQFLWALVTALAILFAAHGLHGICVQFGLLGKKASEVRASLQPAKAGEAALEWEEERS